MAVRPDTVAGYLAGLNSTQGQTLGAVIGLILHEFPELECKLSWNVPQIHRDGKYVFGLSALKNHLALAPWSPHVIEEFGVRLENEGYAVRKNLFQIPNDWKIDEGLVIELVRARLGELDRE